MLRPNWASEDRGSSLANLNAVSSEKITWEACIQLQIFRGEQDAIQSILKRKRSFFYSC
jgi:hypothetical protein